MLVGVALTWTVLVQGVTRETAERDPEAAILINPEDGFALSRAAETQLALAATPGERERAVSLARRSLLREPLEGGPLRILADHAERNGGTTQARRIRILLDQRTRRDAENEAWLFGDALNRGDYSAAFEHADVLMRQDVNAPGRLSPVLVSVLEAQNAADVMARMLATRPSWREAFMRYAVSDAVEPRTAGLLLHAMARTPAPPTDYELRPLIARLVEQGRYRQAYATWRALLPPGAPEGPIYDPEFAGAPGAPPFNWRLAQGLASSIMVINHDGPALRVESRGTGAETLAEQLLVLNPGRYRLSGRMLFSGEGAGEAPLWRLECAGGGALLAKAPDVPRQVSWRGFAVEFEVPVGGCEAQWLRLGAALDQGFGVAEAQFARLRIERRA